MKSILVFISALMLITSHTACDKVKSQKMNILFLHHSTGEHIWGTQNSLVYKVTRKLSDRVADKFGKNANLPSLFKEYNELNHKNYSIRKQAFPKSRPYGWNNYPYDYYNIWVKNSGTDAYKSEPTLELLTKGYQVIIFKHCSPVSNIQADLDSADINSKVKTLSNYKLQYLALRDKLLEFPATKFILFTGAVQVQSYLTEEEALRTREFFTWVKDEWDRPDDNIFLWDLYQVQTDGGLYFKNEYAKSPHDSHPNKDFSEKAARLLFNRVIDVIENDGKKTFITGEYKSHNSQLY